MPAHVVHPFQAQPRVLLIDFASYHMMPLLKRSYVRNCATNEVINTSTSHRATGRLSIVCAYLCAPVCFCNRFRPSQPAFKAGIAVPWASHNMKRQERMSHGPALLEDSSCFLGLQRRKGTAPLKVGLVLPTVSQEAC